MTVAEYVDAREDIVTFATQWCKTEKKNRATNTTGIELFPTFPYLIELLKSLNGIGNTIDEKSKQMLWSWSAMIVALYKVLFQDSFSCKILSRKEALVDDGGINSTTDSLFGRLRFVYNHLPDEMRLPLEFSHMKIVNRKTDSFVKGESTNAEAGRGGTYSMVIADEWAFVQNSESINAAISNACPNNRKYGSTPNGRGNNFARLRFDPESGFKVNTWHWKMNPEKNVPGWYEQETRSLTDEQRASELEIDYSGSVHGRVYYMFDQVKQVCAIEYDPRLPLYTAWDFGIADPTAIIWLQVHPSGEIWIIDEYEQTEQEPAHYKRIVLGKPYGPRVEDIGDPAVHSRGANMQSWFSLLIPEIRIQTPPSMSYKDRIITTRALIPRLRVAKHCVKFQERIANYRYPTNDIGGVVDDSKPIHDWASHMMTALEFFACRKYPVQRLGVTAARISKQKFKRPSIGYGPPR